MDKNILKKISDQEMDRKDFLKYSGLVLLGVVGLKTVASLLFKVGDQQVITQTDKNNTRGFGSGKYGA